MSKPFCTSSMITIMRGKKIFMRDIYKLELIQDGDKVYYRLTIDGELVDFGYSFQELFAFVAYAYDDDAYRNAIERFILDIDALCVQFRTDKKG